MSEQPADPRSRSIDPPVRYLNPAAVRRRAGRPEIAPTWYVADRLIVRGTLPTGFRDRLRYREQGRLADVWDLRPSDDEGVTTALEHEVRRQGCRVTMELWSGRGRGRGRGPGASGQSVPDLDDDELAFVLRLTAGRKDALPDAWEALEADGDDDRTEWQLNLDHVMTAMPFTSQPFTSQPFTSQPFTSQPFTSQPFTSQPFTSQPFTSQPFTTHGMPEYGVPGSGGRAPVQWVGQGPIPTQAHHDEDPSRTRDGAVRPVVAIVDTGIGSHPWFGTYAVDGAECDGAGVVIRDAVLPDGPIGTYPLPRFDEEDAEIGGTSTAPLTGPLDPIAGHGTFIAGIVHQKCPDARLLPVRAVGGSGVAAESEVIESLDRLYRFHRRALDGDETCTPVDVVVLSMGYYHEQPEDLQWDHPLSTVLARLREAGVAVVVAAGNDGETRPEFPAAFAPEVDRRGSGPRITAPKDTSTSRPPILVVGAKNPDGSTALFSNDGPWVTCLRYGASVVSTVPATLDGPRTPSVRLKERYGSGVRSTIDPEGFQGGFATWSGTSFATPVLAGEIASEILADRIRRVASDGDTLRSGAPLERVAEERVAGVWRAIMRATGGLSFDGVSAPS